jgi:hypothetical protein
MIDQKSCLNSEIRPTVTKAMDRRKLSDGQSFSARLVKISFRHDASVSTNGLSQLEFFDFTALPALASARTEIGERASLTSMAQCTSFRL